MPSELIQVLMQRDNLTEKEARDLCQECADLACELGDAEEAMLEVLGVEPDYIIDLMEFL